ncbi:MAG: hypothetical protein E6848_07770 [Bradyrhizobium sp.]|nr:hypothetical protein [Bradyrhizobium sp.]
MRGSLPATPSAVVQAQAGIQYTVGQSYKNIRPRVPLCFHIVVAGLVPAIHVVRRPGYDVDARDKPGHDGITHWQCSRRSYDLIDVIALHKPRPNDVVTTVSDDWIARSNRAMTMEA